MFTYFIQIEPQEEGGFTITVPSLPGCVSEGDTLEEAMANIQDAVTAYLFVLKKHKKPIPMEIQEYKTISVSAKELQYA